MTTKQYSAPATTSFRSPDERGYYGKFGGAFIPEMLYPNVEELRTRYLEIMHEAAFQKEFNSLLKDYVGRPSPLYLAQRLSKKYNTQIYLRIRSIIRSARSCWRSGWASGGSLRRRARASMASLRQPFAP